ncbi:TPA: hypothetical protein N0F65_010027 [Lagenidium giganteum]|uniref:t-SNARE coiled-coil homology domain-containing protein n=1 Tax=Lagenidium giganteum TaxID=4803 RepID=A0AAV2ZDV5_9STRA|nr:TPA: hypothetical protein N0F65_010027 [Lagenidium giganteum]
MSMRASTMTTAVDRTAEFQRLAPRLPAPPVTKRPGQQDEALSAFLRESSELRQSLLAMEQWMTDIKGKYTQHKQFVRLPGPRMSEKEKDDFDTVQANDIEVMELVKNCSNKVDFLNDCASEGATDAIVEYQKEVVAYLLERLKGITDVTKRMQKQRYLQPWVVSSRLLPEDDRMELEAVETQVKLADEKQRSGSLERSPMLSALAPKSDITSDSSSERKLTPRPAKIAKSTHKHTEVTFQSQNEELDISEEQERQFRAENVMLQRHFQENLEDAKKMETKMAEISTLMSQFADKIVEQQTDIEMIHHHAQETSSNVKQSNKILEQTQQIGSGYGFMIFCFYLGFSILLHFLHYFNG